MRYINFQRYSYDIVLKNFLNHLPLKIIVQWFKKNPISLGFFKYSTPPTRKPITFKDIHFMAIELVEAKNLSIEEEKIRIKTRRFLDSVKDITPSDDYTEGISPLAALGYWVIAARREKGLTTDELAEAIGLDYATVFLIENGYASLDVVAKHLKSICKVVGLNYRKTSKYLTDLIKD